MLIESYVMPKNQKSWLPPPFGTQFSNLAALSWDVCKKYKSFLILWDVHCAYIAQSSPGDWPYDSGVSSLPKTLEGQTITVNCDVAYYHGSKQYRCNQDNGQGL